MKIINGLVCGPEGFFEQRTIRIVNGRFADPTAGSPNEETVNAEGLFLIPGLTDIHFHGAAGHDFCEGTRDAIREIARYEERNGVTQICPATMTLPEEMLLRIVRTAAEYRREQSDTPAAAASGGEKSGALAAEVSDREEGGAAEEAAFRSVFSRQTDPGCRTYEKEIQGASLVGIHLEGPFLSEAKRGAQSAAYLRKPDPELFERIMDAADNLVKIVDIAPELEGTAEFLRRERGKAVCSFAHSDASYEEAMAGFEAGITQITHLYNAMRPIHHRNPGPIPAGADAGVRAELICDGVHVHPAAVRAAFDLFGEDHIIFISDSVASAGAAGESCMLGGEQIVIRDGKALRPDGTLAGGNRNLMENLVNAVKTMDIPFETAVKCAAVNPAKAIGIYEEYGSIEEGKIASLAGLDAGLRLCAVWNHGRRIV